MENYVALLRAVNVGGTGVIKMADLKKAFEALGYKKVVTYIQSGNVIFSTVKSKPAALSAAIQKKIKAKFGHESATFVLTPEELKKAAANNPFKKLLKKGSHQCVLMFLAEKPEKKKIAELMSLKQNEYLFAVKGKVLYYVYDLALAYKRKMINFEKILGVSGTGRTWKVVDKLVELSEKPAGL